MRKSSSSHQGRCAKCCRYDGAAGLTKIAGLIVPGSETLPPISADVSRRRCDERLLSPCKWEYGIVFRRDQESALAVYVARRATNVHREQYTGVLGFRSCDGMEREGGSGSKARKVTACESVIMLYSPRWLAYTGAQHTTSTFHCLSVRSLLKPIPALVSFHLVTCSHGFRARAIDSLHRKTSTVPGPLLLGGRMTK